MAKRAKAGAGRPGHLQVVQRTSSCLARTGLAVAVTSVAFIRCCTARPWGKHGVLGRVAHRVAAVIGASLPAFLATPSSLVLARATTKRDYPTATLAAQRITRRLISRASLPYATSYMYGAINAWFNTTVQAEPLHARTWSAHAVLLITIRSTVETILRWLTPQTKDVHVEKITLTTQKEGAATYILLEEVLVCT